MARERRYVIVKSVMVREKPDNDSNPVIKLSFGRAVTLMDNFKPHGGWVFIEAKTYTDNKRQTHYGWVLRKALIATKIEDYARLTYYNKMNKRVPISMRYNDPAVFKYLPIGERVEMIARVGDWCLTDKGWSKFCWFEKEKEVFDQDAIESLFYSVLEQAVKDYRRAINKLKQRNVDDDSFIRAIITVDDVTSWFLTEYKIFFDTIPGEKRLHDINEDVGVDEKWLKEKHRHARYIAEKRGNI